MNSKCLRFASLFVGVPILIAAAACTSSSSTPTSPSSISNTTTLTADALASTWRVQSIQLAGQAEQSAPAGADYTVTFTDRLSVRADCNSCSSTYSIDGAALTVAQAMACTRAACPTMTFESVFTQMLTGQHTVVLSGQTMTWTSSQGIVRFTR